jgi:hypothetical protein
VAATRDPRPERGVSSDGVDKAFWARVFLLLHVVGAISALGPTLTYGIWLGLAERADAATRAFVLRSISWLDARLPTPAYMAQAVTGVVLIWLRDGTSSRPAGSWSGSPSTSASR